MQLGINIPGGNIMLGRTARLSSPALSFKQIISTAKNGGTHTWQWSGRSQGRSYSSQGASDQHVFFPVMWNVAGELEKVDIEMVAVVKQELSKAYVLMKSSIVESFDERGSEYLYTPDGSVPLDSAVVDKVLDDVNQFFTSCVHYLAQSLEGRDGVFTPDAIYIPLTALQPFTVKQFESQIMVNLLVTGPLGATINRIVFAPANNVCKAGLNEKEGIKGTFVQKLEK